MSPAAENPLGTQPIRQLLRKFAVPSIIAMLVSALYNIVDQIFIGQSVGLLGNAATNVAFPLSTICTALSLLFGLGAASNFNLEMGRGRREEAARFAGNGILLLVTSGILMCVLVRVFLRPLMLLFGATPDVLDYSLTYTGITSLGFPFLILSTGGTSLIRADGSPRFSMFCMLSGALVNTVLDALFVFGFHGGIAGAAWATVIGQVVSAAMVAYYFRRFQTVRLDRRALRPSGRHALRIVSLGTTGCFNQLAMMVVQVVMNNSLTHYGSLSRYGQDIPLACAGIIAKVSMIFFSLIIGLSQGLQPIVGYNYGARQYRRVRETYFTSVAVGTAFGIVAFLCFQLFPRQIISAFGPGSEEYFRFAERYFRIFLFFTFFNAIQPISSNFFTSIGKAGKGVFLSLTRQILFLLPLLVLLPLTMGIDGILYAGPLADFAAGVISALFAWRELRRMARLPANA